MQQYCLINFRGTWAHSTLFLKIWVIYISFLEWYLSNKSVFVEKKKLSKGRKLQELQEQNILKLFRTWNWVLIGVLIEVVLIDSRIQITFFYDKREHFQKLFSPQPQPHQTVTEKDVLIVTNHTGWLIDCDVLIIHNILCDQYTLTPKGFPLSNMLSYM